MIEPVKRKYTVSKKVIERNKRAAKSRIANGQNVSPFVQDRDFASIAGRKGAGKRWHTKQIEKGIDNESNT